MVGISLNGPRIFCPDATSELIEAQVSCLEILRKFHNSAYEPIGLVCLVRNRLLCARRVQLAVSRRPSSTDQRQHSEGAIYMEDFGPRLRRLRKERGWSLEKLAEKASFDGKKIHYTTIGKIERSQRKPSGDLLLNLAVALDCSINQLTHQYPEYYNEHFAPVIEWNDISDWESSAKVSRNFVMTIDHHGRAFALRLHPGKADKLLEGEPGYAVVDPGDQDLVDSRIYLIVENDCGASLHRYFATPPRLEALGTGSNVQLLNIGRSPFTVIGRVIWVSMTV